MIQRPILIRQQKFRVDEMKDLSYDIRYAIWHELYLNTTDRIDAIVCSSIYEQICDHSMRQVISGSMSFMVLHEHFDSE